MIKISNMEPMAFGLVLATLFFLGIIVIPLCVGWCICWFATNMFYMPVADTMWNMWLLGLFVELVFGSMRIAPSKD